MHERCVDASATRLRQHRAAHQQARSRCEDNAAKADRLPVEVPEIVAHTRLGDERFPAFWCGDPPQLAILRRKVPHLPVDFDCAEVVVECLGPPDLDGRLTRRARGDDQRGEVRLVGVGTEAEREQLVREPRRSRQFADPPHHIADPAVARERAHLCDRRVDLTQPDVLDRRLPSPHDHGVPVTHDRLAVRVGRHPEPGVLAQLEQSRVHAPDGTLPA